MGKRNRQWPGMIELLALMQGAMKTTVVGRDGGRARPNRTGARFVSPMLAGREEEILQMVKEKKTKADIAKKLGVTRQTLRSHLELMSVQTKAGGKY